MSACALDSWTSARTAKRSSLHNSVPLSLARFPCMRSLFLSVSCLLPLSTALSNSTCFAKVVCLSQSLSLFLFLAFCPLHSSSSHSFLTLAVISFPSFSVPPPLCSQQGHLELHDKATSLTFNNNLSLSLALSLPIVLHCYFSDIFS